MLRSFSSFDDICVSRPEYNEVAAEYDTLLKALDAPNGGHQETIRQWDSLLRRLDTWHAITHLRFMQDTTDSDRKAEQDYCDELQPQLEDLAVSFKRRVLEVDAGASISRHHRSLWEADMAAFDSKIEDGLVRESKLCAEYTALLAGARVSIDGNEYQLSEVSKFRSEADRGLRLRAEEARWEFFAENSEELDRLFDELVSVRTEMARALGFENFIELGYLRMHRVDYNQTDVERFRGQVREGLVPVTAALRERQAVRLGLDKLCWWDEGVMSPGGGPKPQGDVSWFLTEGRTAFDGVHPDLGTFFRMMSDGGFLDMSPREGKAGGGFCTSFDEYGVPFIFMNFSRTASDVRTFIHELGHAFQYWSARHTDMAELTWPTYESAEIHSMALEYLTHPQVDAIMGDGADQYRREHLESGLTFIPYGVAVDHFQHLVYGTPSATPTERHAMWRQMEETYLPTREYGGLEHPAGGGFWQVQRHIYAAPFYYIDYVLALTCALQLWALSCTDRPRAIEAYMGLCKRGGKAPFQTLVRDAGLTSPFDEGCLESVIEEARSAL
jgi:M3 family oligoendopeptidase